MKPNPYRNRMIAKIKLAQKQLGIDDDAYRDLLARLTGKRSSTLLTPPELAAVLREMEQQGFCPNKPSHSVKPLRKIEHTPMINKISALLAETGKTWAYADGMARDMFGKDKVNLLNSDEMHRLVAALQIYANRQKV